MNNIVWEEIYRRQAPLLLAVCRRYVKTLHKAEDLLHDAFLTAIHKQDHFAHTGPVEAWLRKIVVNTALQYLRKEQQMTLLLQSDLPEIATDEVFHIPDDPKSTILLADFGKDDLLAALDLLPAHHRAVFNLYVFESYSHKEIGAALDISAGTSKSHLARARKKIQSILLKKAQDMKEKRKRAAIFLFPLFKNPESYIDRLYKKTLSKNSIPPGQMPAALAEALKKASPLPPQTGTTTLIGLKIGATALVVLTIVSGGAWFWTTAQTTTHITAPSTTTNYQMAQPADIDTAASATNPLTQVGEKEALKTQTAPPLPSHTTVNAPKAQPSVVVNKKVILKDTVYQLLDQDEER